MCKYTVLCYNYGLFLVTEDKIKVVVTETTDYCARRKAKQIVDRDYYEIIKIEEI